MDAIFGRGLSSETHASEASLAGLHVDSSVDVNGSAGKKHMLFSSSLPLTVRSSVAAMTTTVVIQAQFRVQLVPSSAGVKTLQLAVTDPDDPLLLYSLAIAEHDYIALKHEQGLVVDFHIFPNKLVELIERCKRDAAVISSSAGRLDTGRLMAQLCTSDASLGSSLAPVTPTSAGPSSNISSSSSAYTPTILGPHRAHFSIIETNTFKHITHLSLLFTRANDSIIKRYLASVISDLKNELALSQSSGTSSTQQLERQLAERIAQVDTLEKDLDRIRAIHTEEISKVRTQTMQETTRERDKAIEERHSIRHDCDREKRELEQRLQDDINSIRNQLNSTERSYTQQLNHIQQLENQLEQMRQSHSKLSDDYSKLNLSYNQLQPRSQQLERDNTRLQADVTRLENNMRSLEVAEKEHQNELRNVQRELNAERSHKIELETQLTSSKSQMSSMETSIQQCTAEIAKGNEIIARLQNDLKQAKSKLKLKSIVTVQQEKLLDERGKILEQLRGNSEKVASDLAKYDKQMNEKDIQITELQQKNEELKKTTEENTRVIEWLHKQLNDDVMGHRGRNKFSTTSLDVDKEIGQQLGDQYGLSTSKMNGINGRTSTSPVRRTFSSSPSRYNHIVNKIATSPEPSKRARAYLESLTNKYPIDRPTSTQARSPSPPPKRYTTMPLTVNNNNSAKATTARAPHGTGRFNSTVEATYTAGGVSKLPISTQYTSSQPTKAKENVMASKKQGVKSNYF